MSTKYAHKTVEELKKELRKRGKKVTGPKRTLIARLAAADRKKTRKKLGARKTRKMRSIRGARKLKKTGHSTPYRVRKARQILRHSASAASRKKALATIRAYNRQQSKISKHPKISVVHKGLLEVPRGRSVMSLPVSHFKRLIKAKGARKIMAGLTNLQRWNENKNPKLSNWAKRMKAKLRK